MSVSPPLSDLELYSDYLSGIDLFSPHLRILSLGGIRVHEGAWTAGELLHQLSASVGESELSMARHDSYARVYVQREQMSLIWVSSLVGLHDTQIAVLFLDARLDEWVKKSAVTARDELIIWHKARQRAGQGGPLYLWIWIEVEDATPRSPSLDQEIERSLQLIERALPTAGAIILGIERGSALAAPSDQKLLWSSLTQILSKRYDDLLTLPSTSLRDCMDAFTLIPSGRFYQGGGLLSSAHERPAHRVKISRPLWVSQTPVTQALWSLIWPERANHVSGAELSHPVAEVSWFDAVRFCNRLSELSGLTPAYSIEDHHLPEVTWHPDTLGFRLLTEAEWEYVCRGGVPNSPHQIAAPLAPAWTAQRAQMTTHPVAQLPPNSWGLFDCLGNVAEWCQDALSLECYQHRARARLTIDPCELDSPSSERVLRGGSFDTEPYLATPSRRDGCLPTQAWSTVGLRIARPHFD